MQKFVKTLFLVITICLVVLAFTACNGAETTDTPEAPKIVSLEVKASTVPASFMLGSIDLSRITLIVKYDDGDPVEISADEDMVAVADRAKLLKQGTQTISLLYGGMQVKVTFNIVKPKEVQCEVKLRTSCPSKSESTGEKITQLNPIKITFESETAAAAGKVVDLQAPSIEGYEFVSWKLIGEEVSRQMNAQVLVKGNCEYTAYYNEVEFYVHFDSDEGSDIAQMKTREIRYPDMPIPTKEAYIFAGWMVEGLNDSITFVNVNDSALVTKYIGGEELKDAEQYVYTVSKDTNLKAIWEPLGLEFEPLESDGYAVVGYSFSGKRSYLEIPAVYRGRSVVEITATAFATKVTAGNGAVSYDYKSAKNLKEICIGKNVRRIADYAFSNCTALETISIQQGGVSFLISGNALLSNDSKLIAYPAGRMETVYELPAETTAIGNGAFMNCNIGGIRVLCDLTAIGDNAFNSRTLDFVYFARDLNDEVTDTSRNIFNENISHIYLYSVEHRAKYVANASFAPYADKMVITDGTFTSMSIYSNVLLRRIIRESNGSYINQWEIIGANRSNTSLIFPTVAIDTYYVSSIAPYAFYYCTNLDTVRYDNAHQIDRISQKAFIGTKWIQNDTSAVVNGCLILNNVLFCSLTDDAVCSVPSNVIKIAEGAFTGRISLTEVKFETNTESATAVSSIGVDAFAGCVNLSKFTLPKTVKQIGNNAFLNTRLSDFIIPDESTLESIGKSAFKNARGLKRLDFPQTIQAIAEGAFEGCISLEAFSIDGTNSNFVVKDGVLFQYNKALVNDTDSNGQILHTYPSARMAKEYIVPENTKIIASYAFNYPNVGGIALSGAILTNVKENALIAPQLTYFAFGTNIPTFLPLWSDIFVSAEFCPEYIVILDTDNTNYSVFTTNLPSGSQLVKRSSPEFSAVKLYESSDFVYTTVESDLKIVAAKRNKTSLVVNSTCSVAVEGEINPVEKRIVGVGRYAFISDVLTDAVVGVNVTELDDYAFYKADVLERITFKRPVPPLISENTFKSSLLIEKLLIYVPTDSVDSYVTAYGSTDEYVLPEGTSPRVTFDFGYSASQGGDNITYEYSEDNLSALGLEGYTADRVLTKPVVIRTGYKLIGWFTEPEAGEEISFPFKIKKISTLYAHWAVEIFNITYYAGDYRFEENAVLVNTVSYGSDDKVSVPIRKGYDFIGWYGIDATQFTNNEGNPCSLVGSLMIIDKWWITSDTTLYARWIKKNYSVIYDADGGSVKKDGSDVTSTQVTFKEDYELVVPTKSGYTFAYWALDGVQMTLADGISIDEWTFDDNKTFNAVWIPNKYTVTMYITETESKTKTVTFGEPFVLEPLEGNFFGWFENADGSGKQYTDENGIGINTWDIDGEPTVYSRVAITIGDYQGLLDIANNPSQAYVLTSDIVAEEGSFWTPIPSFSGILDGGDEHYTITGLRINAVVVDPTDPTVSYCGMFGVNSGTIRNLNLYYGAATGSANIDVSCATSLKLGGVAGKNLGTIENCTVNVSIAAEENDTADNTIAIGGIAGENTGLMKSCALFVSIDFNADDQGEATKYLGVYVGRHIAPGRISECTATCYTADLTVYGNLGDSNVGSKDGSNFTIVAP